MKMPTLTECKEIKDYLDNLETKKFHAIHKCIGSHKWWQVSFKSNTGDLVTIKSDRLTQKKAEKLANELNQALSK